MRWARTAAETRAAEAGCSADERTLIARASWSVARHVLDIGGRGYGLRVLVVAGSGHNGADALWAGVHLARRGAGVFVCSASSRPDGHSAAEARQELGRVGATFLTVDDVGAATSAYDVGVDGLLGVGYRARDLTADASPARAVGLLRDTCRLVVAVDLPSGVDADTGAAAEWAVAADLTVTFGSLKPGLVVGAGAELAGVVEVADIGLPPPEVTGLGLVEAADVARLLPQPPPSATKYTRGGVGLVGGGADYPGAAVLAAGGALRAGAGIVRVHAPAATIAAVRARWPEVVGVPVSVATIQAERKVDAWVAGPGLGTDDTAMTLLDAVLARDEPVILDADAITLIAQQPERLRRRTAPTVLTPHTGEFERLTGVTQRALAHDLVGAARAAAADLGAVVLLKGMRTVVATPDGTARVNPTGTSWLATAGSGDVLAGAVACHLAAGLTPLDAAAVAAWLHGIAGHLAATGAPVVASDISEAWPDAVRAVLGSVAP